MKLLWIDLYAAGLAFLFLWKLKIIRRKGIYNELYLSRDTTSSVKGLLALSIVFHHLAQRTLGGPIFHKFFYTGAISASLFFFFSGYGLMKRYLTDPGYPKHFLSRRVMPVLLTYLLATGIYWTAYAAFGKAYSLGEIGLVLWQGSPIVPFSWFVINILLFYLVFFMLMRLPHKNPQRILAGAGLFCILWTGFCAGRGYGLFWSDTTPLLAVGMLWAQYEERILEWIRKRSLPVSLICLGGFLPSFLITVLLSENTSMDGIKWPANALAACFFVLLFLLFSQKALIGNPVLHFFGRISFELYLMQGLFIGLLRNDRFYIESEFLWCGLVLAGTTAAAWALSKIHSFLTALLPGQRQYRRPESHRSPRS